jgi:uncharacterized repeat protein (TIGR03803 family)
MTSFSWIPTRLLLPLALGVPLAYLTDSSVLSAALGIHLFPDTPLLNNPLRQPTVATQAEVAQAAPKATRATIRILHTFRGTDRRDGAFPFSGLALSSAGNLFGTTSEGGRANNKAEDRGTIFSIGRSGRYRVRLSFNGKNAEFPTGSVTLAGNNEDQLFGTTYQGGPQERGTIYRLSLRTDRLTILHNFNERNGAFPFAKLTPGPSGNFYGTTTGGGARKRGTVFRITPGGRLTTIRSFGSREGSRPYGSVALDGDGNLYGTNYLGGAQDRGTIFKLAPNGRTLALHSFSGRGGAYPFAGVTLDSDGNAYGTTCNGGSRDKGVVYRWSARGQFKVIHNFNGRDGSCPYAAVTLDADGTIYGTTDTGGRRNRGTVFQLTPRGALTTLHNFTGGADGSNPRGEVILDPRGNLYGTARLGGRAGSDETELGTVFKLILR